MKKKILFGLAGILFLTALGFNITVSLNKAESVDVSLNLMHDLAFAQQESTNDGFIELNPDCNYEWWEQNPFTGEWHFYSSPGHITECWISWLPLGCDAHACIYNL